jgi:hypothetical protein
LSFLTAKINGSIAEKAIAFALSASLIAASAAA